MLKLANDILTGRKAIADLTLDECTALIERFSGDDDIKTLWSDVEFHGLDEAQTLEHAQLGAKIALDGAEDDEEYWSMYGDRTTLDMTNSRRTLNELSSTLTDEAVWIFNGEGECEYYDSIAEACVKYGECEVSEVSEAEPFDLDYMTQGKALNIYIKKKSGAV